MKLCTSLAKWRFWLSSSAVPVKVLGRHRPILKCRLRGQDKTPSVSGDGHFAGAGCGQGGARARPCCLQATGCTFPRGFMRSWLCSLMAVHQGILLATYLVSNELLPSSPEGPQFPSSPAHLGTGDSPSKPPLPRHQP